MAKHPLAVKMMFNFHAESNAQTILRAMRKETIVAQSLSNNADEAAMEWLKNTNDICISPHPNIVKMYTAFVDDIPAISDSMELYPDALPKRINPHGYGRNMSLFVVMKRYHSSLRAYLSERPTSNNSWRSNLIIMTQILEGVVHLSRYKVAHRDLKTDNILVSSPREDHCVQVVITDFGCCWANPTYGFRCPYTTDDIDKGGNAALMAPEVANASPGLLSFINYEKADVWAVGAISYEIFGHENPFYSSKDRRGLDSRAYRMRDLPSLSSEVPPVVNYLVKGMLRKNPNERVSASEAAVICHLLLWAPRAWTTCSALPSSQDILQWLLAMTTKVLYECRFSNKPSAHTEYQLVATFLSSVTIRSIKEGLHWIRDHSHID